VSDIPPNSALSRAALQLTEEHGDDGWRLVRILQSVEGVATNWGDSDGSILRGADEPLAAARRGDLPDYYRADAEGVVSGYLTGSLRNPIVDRYLVRFLLEQEFFAYALTELAPQYTWRVQILKRIRPINTLLLHFGANVVFFAFVAAVLWVLVKFTPLPELWAVIISSLLAIWIVIGTVFQILTLPFVWTRNKEARSAVEKVLLAQTDAYLSLQADGPISVSRVRLMVDRAADAGTVWPQTLFALLDDIASRGATM